MKKKRPSIFATFAELSQGYAASAVAFDAGDMVSDASRGLLYTQWNTDGHPMQYDLEGGHRQLLGWDAFGNHLYTSYETSVAPVSAGMRPGRTRRTSFSVSAIAMSRPKSKQKYTI